MTRTVNGGAGFLTEKVNARSIAEFFRQKGKHRFDDFFVNRRCG